MAQTRLRSAWRGSGVVARGLDGLAADRWLGYVGGYWKAADVIFERVVETGRDQDMLVYPYLMCWRHFVELQLKNLTLLSGRYLRETIELPRTHRLGVLWRVVRACLERAWPDECHREFDEAGRIILQLDGFDPTSEHFRYPIRNDGSETMTTLGRIHMPSFHEAMSGVAAMLDAADTGLRVMTEQRNEIEAEYAAWMA
jgi:hypothetical protein